MRRIAMLLLVACACSSADTVPDSPSPENRRAVAAKACPAVTKPFFYSLTKDGKTSYLLGTRHASVGLAKFPAAVREAFEKASVLVVESDLQTHRETQQDTIEHVLGPEDFARYRKLVGKQIADAVNRNGIQSAAASIVLLYEDFDQSVDLELLKSARMAKREVVFLEDEAETATIANNLLGATQVRKMLDIARTRAVIAQSTEHDLALYCAGEWESSALASLAQPAVLGRNEKWIERLDKLATERDGVFIAVGNSHVIGMTGLIDMLQKRGYKLARNPELPTTNAGSAP